MKREMQVGKTDYSALVFIADPAQTDGSGKTGLVAANLTVSGTRMETDNDAVVTDYTSSLNDLAALTSAHNDWGLKEISSTLAPGLYRLDIADAIFASGAWTAVVYVMITTSAAAPSPMEFVLVAHDPDDLGTKQSGDSYAIVNHGTNGNAAIKTQVAAIETDTQDIQSRLPSALTGAGNIKADAVALSGDSTAADNAESFFDGTGYAGTNNVIPRVTLTDTLTTYTGNTPQTGDAYARIGLNGAGLSAIPWNASWDSEVQSEVDDALVAQRLDELLNADSDIDGAAPPTVGSVFHELMTKTAGSFTYDQATDSLEALRDRGDAAWITATGFSTHSAADVWSVTTRLLTAGTNIVLAKGTGVTGFNDIAAGTAMTLTTGERTDIANEVEAQIIDDTDSEKVLTAITDKIASVNPDLGDLTLDAIASSVWSSGTRTLTAIDEDSTTLDLDGTIRAAVGLAAANLDTQLGDLPTAAEIRIEMDANSTDLDDIIAQANLIPGTTDGLTFDEKQTLFAAVLLGKASGLEGTTAIYRAADDSKDRVTATVDDDGNRSAVTLDAA